MIRSFADNLTEQIFNRRYCRRQAASQRLVFRKLQQIHSVTAVEELYEAPGNRLEVLKGRRNGQWSLQIDEQLRICFRWSEGDAYEVQIIDYY